MGLIVFGGNITHEYFHLNTFILALWKTWYGANPVKKKKINYVESLWMWYLEGEKTTSKLISDKGIILVKK